MNANPYLVLGVRPFHEDILHAEVEAVMSVPYEFYKSVPVIGAFG